MADFIPANHRWTREELRQATYDRLNADYPGIPVVDLDTCKERVEWLKARRAELVSRSVNGSSYARPTADAWKDVANAYADEAGDPRPEFKFLPKGTKTADELWKVADQLERDRDELETQIGEYAYALRAAITWGNLCEALRRN